MAKLTIGKKGKFYGVLRDGASVSAAAKAIGIARQSLYAMRAKDEGFASEWDDAVEEGTDILEDEAIVRARNSSDVLLIFMLKARRPDKFKDRQSHEHSGGLRVEFNMNYGSSND